ncbi:acyltransferase family protein [Actinoplanes sp. NPDC051513]|uniref:acyltransferase family protein n=1 Tax=Actinoplanes sp. NPDC051513 TaxID=3363908 RepID=UPI0037A96B75
MAWFAGGGVGVNIFFVLSGFLITSLLLTEREKTGGVRLGMFYMRRVLRLYPALAAMLLFTLIIGGGAVTSALIAGTYTKNLFMLFGLNPVSPYGHTWSLALEEQFYLIWPLLLPLFVRAGRRAAVALLTVLAIASAMWAQLAVTTVIKNGDITVAVFNPLWQAHGLLIGCALAFVIRHRSVPRAGLLSTLGLAGCLAVAVAASITVDHHWAADWNLLSEFAAAALIAGMRDQATGLIRVFTWRPVVWLGERSYAIYLWHLPLITVAPEHGYGKPGILAAWVLTVVAAALSWRFVEKPFLRLKKRFEPTRQPRPPRRSWSTRRPPEALRTTLA